MSNFSTISPVQATPEKEHWIVETLLASPRETRGNFGSKAAEYQGRAAQLLIGGLALAAILFVGGVGAGVFLIKAGHSMPGIATAIGGVAVASLIYKVTLWKAKQFKDRMDDAELQYLLSHPRT